MQMLVVMGGNELLGWAHAGAHTHAGAHAHGTGDVGDGDREVEARREVVVAGVRRLLLERAKVIVLAFEVFVAEAAERLAILT